MLEILTFLILAGIIFLAVRSFSAPRHSAELERMERSFRDEIARSRGESNNTLKNFNDSLLQLIGSATQSQQQQLSLYAQQITELVQNSQKNFEALRQSVEQKLTQIQQENNQKLEDMRKTVDEKLQSTLEKRLSESFKLVSERLEQVHKGLGEMQNLATGVGDLKKVLSNVKTRGTWGEVQLGALLEQVLIPGQYLRNVSTKNNRDMVEFAIVLPGKSPEDDKKVLLPIDAKFPMEDYQRLLDAEEKNDLPGRDAAAKALEITLKNCAKTIQEKYISPPDTTDFAILYLPTESLFAEVVRRPGLSDMLQREYRVVAAGPTTIWSILNSLQMGFRTLAIEQRSSEVWKLLEAVKAEWTKYEDILIQLHRKISTAANSVEDTQRRVRAIGRKLKNVQELPNTEAHALLELDELPDESNLADETQ